MITTTERSDLHKALIIAIRHTKVEIEKSEECELDTGYEKDRLARFIRLTDKVRKM